MRHLISQYPLTQQYIQHLSTIIGGPVEPVVVSTITAKGYSSLLRHFHNLRAEAVYIPVADAASKSLIPPLQILAIISKAKQFHIISEDFSISPFGWADAFLGALKMLLGTISGIFAVAYDSISLRFLLKARRIRMQDRSTRSFLYLKTNLWLGIQAGGSIAHASGVIKGMLDRGCAVDFVSAETPKAMPKSGALTFTNVETKPCYVIPREINHYRHNKNFFNAASRKLENFDGTIYQRLSLGNYSGVLLSRRYGLPLIIEYNGSENWLANNWGTPLLFKGMAKRAENVCFRHAHLVVTVSDILRDELVQRGVEPARIVTHPNGVSLKNFNSDRFSKKDIQVLREQYGIPADAVVVTFVGTFGPWHGSEVFAKCIAEMAQTDAPGLKKRKLHFMFIGDGVRRPLVESLTASPEVRRQVTVVGLIDQEETPLHLAASDIFVSPHVPNPDGSRFFGSPTKLFEYLGAGRPVIGSDIGQIADILAGCPHAADLAAVGTARPIEAFGVLVKPEDLAELQAAIIFLSDHPDWRAAAGRNARQQALQRYTWDHHVATIFDGLKRVRALDAAAGLAPVRILFNGLHSKSGGGLTYLKNVLALFAADRGVDIHLCIHRDQQSDLPEAMEGITIHYLNFRQGFWRLQVAEQVEVPWLARHIGAVATFSPANYGPLLAPNSVILLRNALSVAFIEHRPLKLAYWALVYLGTFLSMITARRVITVSEYARGAASGGLIGLFSDRMTVVPHGVSRIFSPPKKGTKRGRFLLTVADIYVQKNLKNLIRAMSRLAADHPDTILKIAGRPVDMDYFVELKQIVAKENLIGRVEFLGGVSPETLVDLYRRCGVFVFPSTVETFGNPLVEAMACGAPIASSHTAAMPEVVGDAAVFFDPGNVADMASAIDRLIKDGDLRRDLSRKAIERAKRFSWATTAARTLAIIKEAAASP
jgi:glycosyltransferase involved in cell wall biosynthesis